MRIALMIVLIAASSAVAQKTFELNNASSYFDIKVQVAKCDDDMCSGRATFAFYKKGGSTPYQVIDLPDTEIWL